MLQSKSRTYWMILTLAAVTLAASVGYGAGLMVPTNRSLAPLVIKSQKVTVELNESVATTQVEQVFANRSGRAMEAVYIFPLPKGASVAAFSMSKASCLKRKKPANTTMPSGRAAKIRPCWSMWKAISFACRWRRFQPTANSAYA